MQCPTCGATLPDDARFCGACGTDLAAAPPPAAQPPVQPTSPIPVAPMPATPPQYAPPVGQAPSSGYAPASGAPIPGAQPPAPKKNTGLIVGIVIGVLVLLTLCAVAGLYVGIPGFIAFQAARQKALVGSASTASQGEQPAVEPGAAQPGASGAQPPAAEPAPEAAGAALSEATARQLVTDYLGYANRGDTAKAKALVTSKYLSRITSDYYTLAGKDLKVFEVVKVEQADGGYMVFVKETWSSGVWTNWYLVADQGGKLVIDDTGTE